MCSTSLRVIRDARLPVSVAASFTGFSRGKHFVSDNCQLLVNVASTGIDTFDLLSIPVSSTSKPPEPLNPLIIFGSGPCNFRPPLKFLRSHCQVRRNIDRCAVLMFLRNTVQYVSQMCHKYRCRHLPQCLSCHTYRTNQINSINLRAIVNTTTHTLLLWLHLSDMSYSPSFCAA